MLLPTMRTRQHERPLLVALLLGAFAQLLFSIHLGWPTRLMFDETHYVPAARMLQTLTGPANKEHPLLGKLLIGIGMSIFGDNPIGWRALSTVAGTATVLGGYAFLLLLLRSVRFAAFGAVLIALNQLVFVQARIGMLDGFMAAFLIWGMALLLSAARARRPYARWIGGSALMGASVAVKWTAAPYVPLAGLAYLVLRPRGNPLRPLPALALLGSVSLGVYFLSFLPAFFYTYDALTLTRLLPFQWEMYRMQTQALAPHTYQSSWWSWPLMLRPIWYFYEPDGDAVRRGVLLIGNPIILWGGLIAVLACYHAWLRERAAAPLATALLWTISLALWALVPKPIGFFYYYYLPSIFLCLATAAAFHHYDRGRGEGRERWFAGAAALMFAYFYPILSAAPLASEDGFANWTWFMSWR